MKRQSNDWLLKALVGAIGALLSLLTLVVKDDLETHKSLELYRWHHEVSTGQRSLND